MLNESSVSRARSNLARLRPTLLLAFVLALPGCGGDSSNSDTDTRIAALETTVANLEVALQAAQAAIAAQEATVDTLRAELQTLQASEVMALEPYVAVTTPGGLPRATFTGINLQVVNGEGSTATVNGVGNLIIGYDEVASGPFRCSDGAWPTESGCLAAGAVWAASHKSGSHYLVLGQYNNYSAFGGVVAGESNTSNRAAASVFGGRDNTASGQYSVVSGGQNSIARGLSSSVTGGSGNYAVGPGSSVTGGFRNSAGGVFASVGGGNNNAANGAWSSVSGGNNRVVGGDFDWAAGGLLQDW